MAKINYSDHTDTVEAKIARLQAARESGNTDLALSLAESLKDSLSLEQQQNRQLPKPAIPANEFYRVDTLPKAWANWAEDWSFYKVVELFETVGIGRVREPIEFIAGFRSDHVNDLCREIRVARVVESDGNLREVISQVDDDVRSDKERHCRIIFLADVPMHGRATYLIFFGNPNAELPRYTTDLRTEGEGYGLDVENVHYTAKLSRQMGQLERMTLKRAEGLELFSGGTGHGEPPTIDWSCDYVDEGGLQKLRIRSWAECPNFEVTKGPLAVRVRRWGFPHSPLHPVFAPARMHIDQTYTFYAGQSWFLREGSMDIISDLQIQAMRDDEWVFSGYSFTDPVWIDREGKFHEGQVPREEQDDMWGVGFFHRDSREAFISLRLEHNSSGFDNLNHGGRPILDYPHHGQIWARYPASNTKLESGTSFHQRNAYSIAPYPETGGPEAFESLRHRLLHPIEIQSGDRPRPARPTQSGSLAREGETKATAPLKPTLWRILREVRDEQLYHINANIVDLGYVYDLRVLDGGIVEVLVTMPHRGRPVYQFLVTRGGGRVEEGIRDRLMKLNGVREVIVKFTWNPPWTIHRLTDTGRTELDLD
ncbi:MAG: hypothetical protein CMO80_03940 [Verrucomicrobiales bacterium]|nr:hypothetical protein [Verrucomicrobiales bacterium]|tara:strand:+ start:12213 stop:13997 length:1785 start_codon:yes stop_codon:yes gene_type:complete